MSVFSITRVASMLAIGGMTMLGTTGQAEQPSQSSSQSTRSSSDRQIQSTQDRNVYIYDRSVIGTSDESRLSTSVTLPAGIQAKEGARESAVMEAVRDVFATATDAALSGDMKKLVEQLSGTDRQRLEADAAGDETIYRASLDRFNSTWQSAYQAGWKLVDREEVFGPRFMAIQVGEIKDASQLTGWPIAPTMSRGQTTGSQERVSENYFANGRDVAIVVLPAAGNAPELTVSMIHEAPDFWKIDIPDNMSIDQLRTNLTQHLDQVSSTTNQWPSDNFEANRMAARHVLMSLYGVPATAGSSSSTSRTSSKSGTSDSNSGSRSNSTGASSSIGINTPAGGAGVSGSAGSSGVSGGAGVNTPAGSAGAAGSAGSQ